MPCIAGLTSFTSDNQADGSLIDGGNAPLFSQCPVAIGSGAYHTEATDNLGRTVLYAYDQSGNLSSVTGIDGSVISYTYNADHLLTAQTSRRGQVSLAVEYSADGRVSQYTERGQAFTLNTNEEQYVSTKTDSDDRTWTYGYNESGVRIMDIDPLGNTVTRDPNPLTGLSEMNWIEDENGRITKFTYDARGNRTSRLSCNGLTEYWTYDDNNRVTTYTGTAGDSTRYFYDAHGDIIRQVTQSFNDTDSVQVWEYTYDAHGNKTGETDPSGAVSLWQYDAKGNLLTRTDTLGNGFTYTYDSDNNVVQRTDALNRTTIFEYDAWSRLVKKIGPENDTIIQEWTAM